MSKNWNSLNNTYITQVMIEDYEQNPKEFANDKPDQGQYQALLSSDLKVGDFCMLRMNPCQITKIIYKQPIRHRVAKVYLFGHDIFVGQEYQDAFRAQKPFWVPIVKNTEYEVADIGNDGFVTLLLPDCSLKQNVKLPKDKQLNESLLASWNSLKENQTLFFKVMSACGREEIISFRVQQM